MKRYLYIMLTQKNGEERPSFHYTRVRAKNRVKGYNRVRRRLAPDERFLNDFVVKL